jgi:hypothetical protein
MMLSSVPLRHLSLIRGHAHENQAYCPTGTILTDCPAPSGGWPPKGSVCALAIELTHCAAKTMATAKMVPRFI